MASINDAYSENSLLGSTNQSNQDQKSQFKQNQQMLPQYTINYPFWNQNMRQLLMIQQQNQQYGDNFRRYTMDTNGLRDSISKTIQPFNTILCAHGNNNKTQSGSQICSHCGVFIKDCISQTDRLYLDKYCAHPPMYCSISQNRLQKTCGQCSKVISNY